jgi:tetratricopeptide (TPR) repeat protein/ADP-heptose:LPS heptosyltransferase
LNKSPSQEQINKILQSYKNKKFIDVEKLALSLSKDFPDHQFAWKILSIIYKQSDRISESLMAIENAIKVNPLDAESYYNLGNTLIQISKLKESASAYKKAIELNSEYFDAYNNLGVVLRELEELDQSKEIYKKIIKLKPDYAEAYNNLGIIFFKTKELNNSEISYKKAIKLNPKYPEAYNNLGVTLRELDRLDESISFQKKAIELKPNYAEAYNNLGVTYNKCNKLDESEANYQKAIKLKSNYVEAYYNLGLVQRKQGKLEESVSSYKKAIELKSNYAEAYYNLGIAFKELGKLEDSETSYKKAIELKPNYPDVQNSLSHTLLLKKNFIKAYELYEWRWKLDKKPGKKLISKKPLWNGEDNLKIFVWEEQGIGDQIMFFSNVSELKLKSKNIIIQCDKRLIPLFKRTLSEDISYESNQELIKEKDYDRHIPMGSLAKFFRKDLESFAKTSAGYLKEDVEKTKRFRKRLKNRDTSKLIGISWNTKSSIEMSSFRNISLTDLATALSGPNIKLLNLQYGDNSNDFVNLKKTTGIEIINEKEVDNIYDIDGMASLVSACDLVVTIDNYIIHLAGSLGVKTIALLPYNMDSRWGIKDKKSYIYNSVNLYRQSKLGKWDSVLKDLKNEI